MSLVVKCVSERLREERLLCVVLSRFDEEILKNMEFFFNIVYYIVYLKFLFFIFL